MLTNNTAIPLSLAVWLTQDSYEYNDDPNVISATTLLKPIRAIVLGRQNRDLEKNGDISTLIPSRMGSSLHDSIERSWLDINKVKESFTKLGYPESLINKIRINPAKVDPSDDILAIYVEQRGYKQVGQYKVSGKFDFVADGRLEDYKSTQAYSYMMQSNNDKYIQQGSIYRWIFPEIITQDVMAIQYLFTDWSVLESLKNPTYPKRRLVEQKFQLMSIPETESFVNKIIHTVDLLKDAPQEALPNCTDDELWVKPTVWKYYKDPSKTERSTKNFDVEHEAYTKLRADGSVGIIKKIEGEVVRCRYCNVVNICSQAQQYIKQGTLKL